MRKYLPIISLPIPTEEKIERSQCIVVTVLPQTIWCSSGLHQEDLIGQRRPIWKQ